MVEEGLQFFLAPLKRRVASEGQLAELVAVVVRSGMSPRTDHKVK